MQSCCGRVLPPGGSLHISSVCFHQKLLKPLDADKTSPQQSFIRNMRIKTGRLVSTIISCCRFLNHHTNLPKQLVFVCLLICSVNVVNTQRFLLSVWRRSFLQTVFMLFKCLLLDRWMKKKQQSWGQRFLLLQNKNRTWYSNVIELRQLPTDFTGMNGNQWMTQWWRGHLHQSECSPVSAGLCYGQQTSLPEAVSH